ALLHVISQIQKILRSTIARCRRKISGGLISPGSVKAMLHHRQKLNMREAHTLHIFFFPAEDGIRYGHVTGVQTCALPISIITNNVFSEGKMYPLAFDTVSTLSKEPFAWTPKDEKVWCQDDKTLLPLGVFNAWVGNRHHRSEERRVGKECRSRCWPYEEKMK